MEQLQRGILIFLAVLVTVSPGYIEYRQNKYYIETWAEAQTECFFEEICRNGYVTTEEYVAFCERIYIACHTESIFFEEIQNVFGQNGTEYSVFISWEEIKSELEQKGRYFFREGSEIRFYVNDNGYFGLVRKNG